MEEIKKLTWEELCDIFYRHNKEKEVRRQFEDKKALIGVVVYKQSNFNKEYSELQRSYAFSSDNKHFIPGMGGNSIFGDCLDGSEWGVRLDWYNWTVDYCYIKESHV